MRLRPLRAALAEWSVYLTARTVADPSGVIELFVDGKREGELDPPLPTGHPEFGRKNRVLRPAAQAHVAAVGSDGLLFDA